MKGLDVEGDRLNTSVGERVPQGLNGCGISRQIVGAVKQNPNASVGLGSFTPDWKATHSGNWLGRFRGDIKIETDLSRVLKTLPNIAYASFEPVLPKVMEVRPRHR